MSNEGLELHRLQTLLDAARLLNSTLELKDLTQIILDVVRAEVPVERVSVFVVDRTRNSVHTLVAQGVEDFEISVPVGSGIAGTVAATGEVLDIADAYADPRFEPRFDQKLQYHTNDLFTLPVYNRQGDIVGVLQLLNRLRPITAADREFLLGISVYIGLALQNAWSHAQVRANDQFEQELVALRDHLAEAEQLSLVSELINHVLNEISNPLAVAMGYAEFARSVAPLPEKLRSYLDKIARGLDETATAARRLRQFVNSERHERIPLSLGSVLRRISQLRAQAWISHEIEAALFVQTVPQVFANERQLQLVILYLIKTAEHTLLQSQGKRELRMDLSATAQNVRIEIYDSGPARVLQVQHRLSDSPFTTRSLASDASLEFVIASSIVQQHNGTIRVEHRVTGNSVIIELPAHCNDAQR